MSLEEKIILSTGMSNLKEISFAIETFLKSWYKKEKYNYPSLQHSVPCRNKNLNLLSIKYLKDKLNIEVGYSDHSKGFEAALIALSYGARILKTFYNKT